MAGISAFRADNERVAADCRLYDASVAASTTPLVESDIETSFGRTQAHHQWVAVLPKSIVMRQ